MNVGPQNTSAISTRPPQLIPSLVGGFNAVANNIYLILAPVVLDLLLWFGPHVRVRDLFEPIMLDTIQLMRQTGSLEMRTMLDNAERLWKLVLEQYNLLGALSTFPVGIPLMMTGQAPLRTPVGDPLILEIPSISLFILGWLGLTLLGYLFGAMFFSYMARCCARQLAGASGEFGCDGDAAARAEPAASTEPAVSIDPAASVDPAPPEDPAAQTQPGPQASLDAPGITASVRVTQRGNRLPPFNLPTLAWQYIQVIALVIIALIILLFLAIPSIVLASLLSLISPFLGQLVLLVISFGAAWFLVPLVFTPHGIFLCGQSVINAMLNSARIVRYTLPGTGLFILTALILNRVMGWLWNQPPDTSWMVLVGIFGNAVITTGLLASSFIYYRGGLIYIQNIRKLAIRQKVF